MNGCRWLLLASSVAVVLLQARAGGAAPPGSSVLHSDAAYTKISARRLETMRLTREGRFDAVEALLAPPQLAYERGQADEFAAAVAFAPYSTSDEAVGAALERWVAQAPKNVHARLALARWLRHRYKLLRGAEATRADMAVGPDHLRALGLRAIGEYQTVLASRPRFMVAWSDLIEMAASLRDGALLRESYTKAIAIDPASWIVRVSLEHAGGVPDGRYEAFVADAARFEKQNPLLLQITRDGARDRADRLWKAGRHAEALALYDEQVRTLDVFQLHKMRGRLLRVMERYPEALQALDHAIALMPGKYDGYQDRGWVHLRAGRPTEAVADFRHALEIDPLNADLLTDLAEALEQARDFTGSLDAYRLAARWHADGWTLRQVAWGELDHARNPKASVAASERALALDAEDKWAWYVHAKALDVQGDLRAAQSFARFVALADPESPKDREYIDWAKRRMRSGIAKPPAPPASRTR